MKSTFPIAYNHERNDPWKVGLAFVLLGTYGVLFFCILTHRTRVDFSSLYSACLALQSGENPYRVLLASYLPIVQKLPANLNPPFVLWLFNPLSRLPYDLAVAVWSALSFTLGLVGAGIAFRYAFSAGFLKKNWFYLYAIYLCCFSTLIDTGIAQLGALLLFLIMMGYHFYLQNNDYFAGTLWGIIIAIKLFPALLFIYALVQKRYRVCLSLLIVFLLMCCIPLMIYSGTIYTQYFSMMRLVLWYGDSWNASLYGMIFRFINISNPSNVPHLLGAQWLYLAMFGMAFVFYVMKMKGMEKNTGHHQAFCLTLVMMLLMSPFGWLYYFSILILPLSLTYLTALRQEKENPVGVILWFLCLFLVNFPLNYVHTTQMGFFMNKFMFYAFDFYGLMLLAYLTCKMNIVADMTFSFNYNKSSMVIIFSFVMLVVMCNFMLNLVF